MATVLLNSVGLGEVEVKRIPLGMYIKIGKIVKNMSAAKMQAVITAAKDGESGGSAAGEILEQLTSDSTIDLLFETLASILGLDKKQVETLNGDEVIDIIDIVIKHEKNFFGRIAALLPKA